MPSQIPKNIGLIKGGNLTPKPKIELINLFLITHLTLYYIGLISGYLTPHTYIGLINLLLIIFSKKAKTSQILMNSFHQ